MQRAEEGRCCSFFFFFLILSLLLRYSKLEFEKTFLFMTYSVEDDWTLLSAQLSINRLTRCYSILRWSNCTDNLICVWGERKLLKINHILLTWMANQCFIKLQLKWSRNLLGGKKWLILYGKERKVKCYWFYIYHSPITGVIFIFSAVTLSWWIN